MAKRAYKHNKNPHFMCLIWGVAPFNTWLISSWEEKNSRYKLNNRQVTTIFTQNDNFDHFEWNRCQSSQLVIICILFSAWDKSLVKWYNSWNSTQNMRTKGLPSDSEGTVQTLQIQQCTWPRNGVRMEKPSFLKKANTDKACTFV